MCKNKYKVKRFYLHIAFWVSVLLMVLMVVSCSTKKNTATTRFYHAFTANYNTYYNGTLAYIDASLEKEKGNKDNFTERIPLYTVGNKSSRELGKGNYDKAIEKCEKAIKMHSINKRPEWTKTRKKTEKDIEWLSRKEYNPFLWKAWMLMGRSQFYKGSFDDAASTFAWMSRLYKTQPAIYGKARAWLAKCYIEQDWIYDAEDVIRNMQRDSIHWRAVKEWDYTFADYYLHTGELDKASEYLRKVIKHEKRNKQRAREYYLLGQIEASQGNKDAAYRAFRKVIAQNPPYELEFNARISMTEVLAQGQAKRMISRLKRMARNDNNSDYLDQVYYAMGNIYLAQLDTVNAINAYEKGVSKATRTGIEKGVLLLHLGDLYWNMEKYNDAQRCYGEAIGLLDKDRDDYQQLSDRSKVLDELVPFTDAIHLQDSLQVLAKMDEKDRNAAIDLVIKALIKKEKEEAKKLQEENAQKILNQNNNGTKQEDKISVANMMTKNAAWYFYNPMSVQQGKQAFERQWGKRENADDWQRSNKTVVAGLGSESADTLDLADLTDEQRDSIAQAEKKAEEETEKADSAVNDPHKREYYLAQIPFTEEQVAASNEIIKDGLFNSGKIFKDKLDNLPLSEKQFNRLMGQFPEFETMDEVYYHMFLLYSRQGDIIKADSIIELMKVTYPESQWTLIVTDPYFEENARFGKHIEDSLYQATYSAFLEENYETVRQNATVSETRFPLGENRDKFIFFEGMGRLNEGDAKGCVEKMEAVVNDFPKSSVAGIAGMIINGVKEGRRLHGANFSMTDIWSRRMAVMADSDSIAARTFTAEKDIPFTFMLVYNPDSLNENQLIYQMARYNFTSFVVRNFEMEITHDDGLNRLNITGFRSFDEARQYARVLYKSNAAVVELTRKARPFVISDQNIPLLGQQYSYNDYDSFYVTNFASLDIAREYMLYEPDQPKEMDAETKEITPALPSETAAPGGIKPVEAKPETKEGEEEDGENGGNGGDVFDVPVGDDANGGTIQTIDIPVETTTTKKEDTFDVPIETTPTKNDDTFDVPIDTTPTKNDDTFDVPIDTTPTKNDDTFEIPADTTSAKVAPIIANPTAKKEEKKDSTTVNGKKDDKKTATTTANGKKKAEKKADEVIIVDEKNKKKEDDKTETFVIDDGTSTEDDLEDEYYELEGF